MIPQKFLKKKTFWNWWEKSLIIYREKVGLSIRKKLDYLLGKSGIISVINWNFYDFYTNILLNI